MTSTTSVIFCGTPEFAVPSLQALIDDDRISVDLVITQPDKPVGRKQTLTPPPVKLLAAKYEIPVFQPENINTDSPIEAYPDLQPEFLVTVAYGQLLKTPLLLWPTCAPVNVHPSLLPRWRGATPMQHAILSGDIKSGVSIQRMVQKMDAGPVLYQVEYVLLKQETIDTLHNTMAKLGADALVHTLTNPRKETEQNELEVRICKKLSREDGQIHPATMTAVEADRHVRALVPWPGVTCTVEGRKVKLIETSLKPSEDCVELPCAENTVLYIRKLQSPGKAVMEAGAWKRGIR